MTAPAAWRRAGRTPSSSVLMVASEMAPWAKTGGLADVVAALPEALDRLGNRVTVVVPRYRGVVPPPGEAIPLTVTLGPSTHDVVLHVAQLAPRRRVVFVEHARFFDRDGIYGTGNRDFPDNDQRFGLLAAAALDFAQQDSAEERVDIVHAHDWQAGLVPTFLRADPARWPRLAQAGLVLTIHNLAYQGLFPPSVVPTLGLGWEVFSLNGGEFWNRFSFLKAGINYSDFVTTVSPSYARETTQPGGGNGLEGVLVARADRYVGILNGIDTSQWNPATDPLLPAHYDATDLTGKRECKRALLDRFHLPVGDDALARPMIGLVSRLVDQKGIDVIHAAADSLLTLDATWIFLGSGEPKYEQFLRGLAERHPTRVGTWIGFDEQLAHLVEAGADIFLMPSRFEPCGLNQMYSLRYGTVPVVHATGGLDDTIQPYTTRARRANGFKFRELTPEGLFRTVRRAVRLFANADTWLRLVRQGMREDHSWEISAREYVKVYRRARHDAAARAV